MNIEEGSRRLAVVFTWFTAICVWIPGVVLSIKLANQQGSGSIVFLGFVFVLFTGFLIRDICHKVGMWVIKGFAGVENAGNNND